MWKLLTLTTLLCVAAGGHAKDLADAAHLYGEYKSLYTWPMFNRDLPNCSPLVISKPDPPVSPGSCKCGRDSANLAAVNMEVNGRKFNILLDLVSSANELKVAKDDKCLCSNSDMHHDAVWKLDDNYVVHYDTNMARVYLLGKVVPSADQLKGMVEGFFWKDWGGKSLCH